MHSAKPALLLVTILNVRLGPGVALIDGSVGDDSPQLPFCIFFLAITIAGRAGCSARRNGTNASG